MLHRRLDIGAVAVARQKSGCVCVTGAGRIDDFLYGHCIATILLVPVKDPAAVCARA